MWVEHVKDFLGQKARQRIDLDDVNAKSLITNGTAKEVTDNPLDAVIQKSMADMMAKVSGAIESAAISAVKQFVEAQTKSRKNQVPSRLGEAEDVDGVVAVTQPRAL